MMPTSDEVKFFEKAFEIIDGERNTRWGDSYKTLIAHNTNRKVKWSFIPGFLPYPLKGDEYIKAIKRVTKVLLKLIEEHKGKKFQKKFPSLVSLAGKVCKKHQQQLARCKNLKDEIEMVESYEASCDAWGKTSAALHEAFPPEQWWLDNLIIIFVVGLTLHYYYKERIQVTYASLGLDFMSIIKIVIGFLILDISYEILKGLTQILLFIIDLESSSALVLIVLFYALFLY